MGSVTRSALGDLHEMLVKLNAKASSVQQISRFVLVISKLRFNECWKPIYPICGECGNSASVPAIGHAIQRLARDSDRRVKHAGRNVLVNVSDAR